MIKQIQTLLAACTLSLVVTAAAADVVVVVPSGSPAIELSTGQIADLYLGRSNRFPDGSVAVPVDQAEGSPERTEFYTRYTGQSPVQIKMHWSKLIFTGRGRPPRQVRNSSEVKEFLADNPNAIGYIDRSLVDETLVVVASP